MGVPVTGSSTTWQSIPNTLRTQSSVITSAGGAGRDDPSLAHGHEVVRVARREVEVVQDHHDRGAADLVELGEQVEDLDLVGDVEIGRRLVEEQQLGLLGKGHRDPHALPLAAGELVHQALREVQGVGELECPGHGLLVRVRPPSQRTLVGMTPAADEVDHADAFGRDGVLRQQAEGAGHLARRQLGDRAPVQQHRAGGRSQEPGHAAQQRGLAACVGSHDAGDLAVRDVGGQLVDDRRGAVPQGHGVRGQPRPSAVVACVGNWLHQDLLEVRSVASSHSRNGAPRAPVTTPTGKFTSGTRYAAT